MLPQADVPQEIFAIPLAARPFNLRFDPFKPAVVRFHDFGVQPLQGQEMDGGLVSNSQYLWIEFSGSLLLGPVDGLLVGALDEFAVLELGAGADEG
ncbi:hypothetical protein, partial [Mycobacterium persicum]